MLNSREDSYYPSFPVGEGKTDYEKYLKTVDLLSLQKPRGEQVSPEELLFQVTHQTSELWMKQMLHELDKILVFFEEEKIPHICRAFRLVAGIQKILTQQVDLLGQSLSIIEYGVIRQALGRGSGMESPGFNFLLTYPPKLWEAFTHLLEKRQISLEEIYQNYNTHLELHTLAECLMDYDDLFHKWRTHHFDLVMRTIGVESNSLKGIPTQVLQRGAIERCFPELLKLRSHFTNQSTLAYGGSALES
ncbi:MAG: tryptophan 2,3-dioxygenase [Cyanobacteria bacterium]|nr:tryptophan 2,3-dioxygenase [Cyanobacteriota bacterium]